MHSSKMISYLEQTQNRHSISSIMKIIEEKLQHYWSEAMTISFSLKAMKSQPPVHNETPGASAHMNLSYIFSLINTVHFIQSLHHLTYVSLGNQSLSNQLPLLKIKERRMFEL